MSDGATMEKDLEVLLEEEDRFPPPEDFVKQANVSDPSVYEEAEDDFEAWWEKWAKKLHWFEPWKSVLDWKLPDATWFGGARTNLAYNCLDRHLGTARQNKAALMAEVEAEGGQVAVVAQRHGISKSLLYNWRSAWKAAGLAGPERRARGRRSVGHHRRERPPGASRFAPSRASRKQRRACAGDRLGSSCIVLSLRSRSAASRTPTIGILVDIFGATSR